MKFNNQHIYTSIDDSAIEQDLAAIEGQIETLNRQATQLNVADPVALAGWLGQLDQADILRGDISTFASLVSVVDTSIEAAEILESKCNVLASKLGQCRVPVTDNLVNLDDTAFAALLNHAAMAQFKFQLEQARALVPHKLSIAEETLLQKMAVDGLNAWGDQYFKLAGTIQADINGEKVGLASAFNKTMSPDRNERATAWQGIQGAWAAHQDSVVAGLNAINGWRINEFERRSAIQPMHYLDVACHQSHITRDTLNTLIETTYTNRGIGHRAIAGMLKFNGITDGRPWDLMAPPKVESGNEENLSFEDAMDIIYQAFAEFDIEMADFAKMMADKGWIDATPTPNRATGAFCTEFNQAGEPRVFMTFEGTMGNVLTLAHEIGHAWHAWVLKDLGYSEKHYPMTLAETASIFAETLVRQSVLKHAKTDAQKRDILWQEAESASALLINIPARFEFEKQFVEARMQNKVSAKRACEIMNDAWAKWYEDSIVQYDELFWASKLHFSIAELGFYNYPYLFGYLFALGVYAQKDKQGEQFRFAYRDLLKDTGRMSAEACIQKHLGRDITQPDFWQDSLNIVEQSIQQFESLV